MPLKVWITSSNYRNGEPTDFTSRSRQQLADNTRFDFRPAESAQTADIILFIESAQHKFKDYGDWLKSNELISQFPNRCFVFDFADNPAGFLPGVYTSMVRQKHDRCRFRAGAFMGINPFACTLATNEPALLLSFRGFASGPTRRKLLATDFKRPDCVIAQSFKWFNHDDSEKITYGDELRNSKFVLCPRGIGTGTGRVYESMASGRVPVILSDDWVPPMGPSWNDFAIILSESKVDQVATIADRYEPQWRQMGQFARHVYENWFSPEVNIFRTLQACEEIMLYRPANHDEREYQQQWSSWQFNYQNGWTLPQRVIRPVLDGKLQEKIANRLKRKEKQVTLQPSDVPTPVP